MKKQPKKKYYQCNHCGHIECGGGFRCQKCDGAMLKYKDSIGIGIPALKDGKVYLPQPPTK